MKIAEGRLLVYHLPLTRPLPLRDRNITFRDGLLLRLSDELGNVGWGEIAPLPGFSHESMDQAQAEVITCLRSLNHREVPCCLSETPQFLTSWLGSRSLSPSVVCGLEMALSNLVAAGQETSLRQFFGFAAANSIPLNGLLAGGREAITAMARDCVAEGYRTVKLKVGSASVATDIDRVQLVREYLPPEVSLRLDANRSWKLDDAVAFGRAVAGPDIEYIEEPLADPDALQHYYAETNIPYALDESLITLRPESLVSSPGLAAIVLKPTLLGGIFSSLQFASRARTLQIKSVISSSFESAIGILSLAELASAVAPDIPCGLDTGGWIQQDLLLHPSVVDRGRLNLRELPPKDREINMNLLHAIPVT